MAAPAPASAPAILANLIREQEREARRVKKTLLRSLSFPYYVRQEGPRQWVASSPYTPDVVARGMTMYETKQRFTGALTRYLTFFGQLSHPDKAAIPQGVRWFTFTVKVQAVKELRAGLVAHHYGESDDLFPTPSASAERAAV